MSVTLFLAKIDVEEQMVSRLENAFSTSSCMFTGVYPDTTNVQACDSWDEAPIDKDCSYGHLLVTTGYK